MAFSLLNPAARPFSFFKNKRGSVAIEFALVFPIYILVLSSMFELTMFALLQNKLHRLAGVMGDTVARKSISRDALQAYLSQASQFTTPFTFTPGKITISQIQNIDQSLSPLDMRISWQESFNGSASGMGVPGDPPLNLPTGFELTGEQTAIVAEVKYQFTSLVFSSIIEDQEISIFYATVPRGGSMNTLLGEDSIF